MSGLRFVSSDGSIPTVTIHDPATGVYRQLRFSPRSADPRTIDAPNNLTDGTDIPIVTYGNITDEALFSLYTNGTIAGVQSLKRPLERLLDQARSFQRYRRGPRIFAEWRPGDSGSWYRSEVLHGHVRLSDDVLDAHMLPAGEVQGVLFFTHAPFWDGPAAAVPLTNRYGSGTSLQVANIADGSRDNFVTISAGALDGDVPGTFELRYTNTTASATRIQELHVGISTLSASITPSSLTFQAESGGAPIGGTTATDGLAWNPVNSWEQTLVDWTLSSALLSAANGSPYRALARLLDSANVELRLASLFAVTRLTENDWVSPQEFVRLLDLGTLYLPPHLSGLPVSMVALTMRLSARARAAGTGRVSVDYVHLLPAERYRLYRAAGYGIAQGVTLVDTGQGTVYTDGWTGGALANMIEYGPPLVLTPGRTNRVHFVALEDSGATPPTRTGSVQVLYRPRYKDL